MMTTNPPRAIRAIAALAIASGACAPSPDLETAELAAASTVQVLRGTDRASAFSPGEAATLRASFGVAWTGVYIGGPCSAGSGWNRGPVTAVAAAPGGEVPPLHLRS